MQNPWRLEYEVELKVWSIDEAWIAPSEPRQLYYRLNWKHEQHGTITHLQEGSLGVNLWYLPLQYVLDNVRYEVR